MNKRSERIEQLRTKYGANGVENAARLHQHDFPELMEWRDGMDQHYAKLWLLGATPREVLEVILQPTVYAGLPRSLRASAILERVLQEQGRLAELTETQLPLPDQLGNL